MGQAPKGTNAKRQAPAVFLPSAVVLLSVVISGCASRPLSESTTTSSAPTAKRSLQKVRFRLSWLPSSEYAGIFAAVQQGIYARHGIECDVEPGGVGLNSIELVAAGRDEFGLAGGDRLLIARSRGIPVLAVAAQFQTSPQVFFARKSSGITSPAQFVGHTVGIKPAKTAETMFKALVGKLHLNESAIKTVDVKAGMQQFFAGQVDVWPGYSFDEAAQAREHGIPINIIDPSKYGVVLYSDAIFTTDKLAKSNPDLVKEFVQATGEGWEWAAAHPDDALKMVLKDYPDLNAAHEKTRLAGALPLIAGSPDRRVKPVGRMDPAVWKASYEMLSSQHLLAASFPVQDAYTMKFIQP